MVQPPANDETIVPCTGQSARRRIQALDSLVGSLGVSLRTVFASPPRSAQIVPLPAIPSQFPPFSALVRELRAQASEVPAGNVLPFDRSATRRRVPTPPAAPTDRAS